MPDLIRPAPFRPLAHLLLLALSGLNTAGLSAAAQNTAPQTQTQTAGVLPLASVGAKWPSNIETYTIQVSKENAGKPLGLEVYSPALNLTDYAGGRRGGNYFGDEAYSKNGALATTFVLSGPGGAVLTRSYAPGREHTWESLWASGLPAGTYSLKVNSVGDGKNSFALRLAAPFTLETSDFTVNARDTVQRDLLVARLSVPAAWVGKTLSVTNYDIDGPKEALTWVVQPGNNRVNLPSSDNGKSATVKFPITPALVGEWAVYIRVLPTTRQFSNAVTYNFRLDGKPVTARVGGFAPPPNAKLQNQLQVEVLDSQNRPVPGASYQEGPNGSVKPVLPPGYTPASASIVEGKGTVVSPGELRYAPGDAKLRFVAKAPSGALSVDAVAIYGGQRLPLTGVPFELAGKTYTAPITLPLAAGEYPIGVSQLPGSSIARPLPGKVPQTGTGRVTLEYTPRSEITLLTAPDILNACDVTQLIATAKTDFPYKLPSTLNLNLPSGWSSDYPLSQRGDLSAATPLSLKVPVRVCRTDSAEAALDPANLRTTGQASVRNPGGSNISRTVQQGARASLAKSISATKDGYSVTLKVTVDSTLENVILSDPLPSGGSSPVVRGPLSVDGPSLAKLTARLDGDNIVLSRLIPGSYTISYQLITDVPAEQVLTAPDIHW